MAIAEDLATIGRAIIDANVYMTLATSDDAGRPWATVVFYSSQEYTDFYWISSPETQHSRNIAQRPEVSMVVFDSQTPVGEAQAMYLAAAAQEVADDDIEPALTIYPGPASRGARRIALAELRPPGPYRMYRATVSHHWMICPRDTGHPCVPHGKTYDHRIDVAL